MGLLGPRGSPLGLAAALAALLLLATGAQPVTAATSWAVPLHRQLVEVSAFQTPAAEAVAGPQSLATPINGSLYKGIYYMDVLVGSQPQLHVTLVLDTGSSLTHMACDGCDSNCGVPARTQLYSTDTSATANEPTCGSEPCDLLCSSSSLGDCRCSRSGNQCIWLIQYGDGTTTAGTAVVDRFQLQAGGDIPAFDAVFGCQGATSESFSPGQGVMGLGNDDASIIQQLVSLDLIDPAFSFCLESSSTTTRLPGGSVFVFGSASPKEAPNYMQTPLVVESGRSYYQVKVKNADFGEGTEPIVVDQLFILDTGNTGVQLPKKVSYPFTRLLATTLPDDISIDTAQEGYSCYTDTSGRSDARFFSLFPTLNLHMDPNVTLSIAPRQYLQKVEARRGRITYCSYFNSGERGVIGAAILQDVYVRVELDNKVVRFAQLEACSDLEFE